LLLPLNEIHELGLVYLHYEIVSRGYRVVYLGESMPLNYLKDLKKHFNSIIFLSYFTIQPDREYVNDYVQTMGAELLGDGSQIWLIGKLTQYIDPNLIPVDVKVFDSIPDLIEKI